MVRGSSGTLHGACVGHRTGKCPSNIETLILKTIGRPFRNLPLAFPAMGRVVLADTTTVPRPKAGEPERYVVRQGGLVTVGPPALDGPVLAETATSVVQRGHRLESPVRWVGLTEFVVAPTGGGPVSPHSAAMGVACADGCKRPIGGVGCAVVIASPAGHCSMGRDAAGVGVAGAHLLECAGWRSSLTVEVLAPAFHRAVVPNAAVVLPSCGHRLEYAYRRLGGSVVGSSPTLYAPTDLDSAGMFRTQRDLLKSAQWWTGLSVPVDTFALYGAVLTNHALVRKRRVGIPSFADLDGVDGFRRVTLVRRGRCPNRRCCRPSSTRRHTGPRFPPVRKSPSGGSLWPWASTPQHTMLPSVRTPQEKSHVVSTCRNVPSGADDLPCQFDPQHATVPSSRRPQV